MLVLIFPSLLRCVKIPDTFQIIVLMECRTKTFFFFLPVLIEHFQLFVALHAGKKRRIRLLRRYLFLPALGNQPALSLLLLLPAYFPACVVSVKLLLHPLTI